MSHDLEEYELVIRNMRGTLTTRQFGDLDMLDFYNETAVKFLKTCGLHEGDVAMFAWSEEGLARTKRHLASADLRKAASIPAPSRIIRF